MKELSSVGRRGMLHERETFFMRSDPRRSEVTGTGVLSAGHFCPGRVKIANVNRQIRGCVSDTAPYPRGLWRASPIFRTYRCIDIGGWAFGDTVTWKWNGFMHTNTEIALLFLFYLIYAQRKCPPIVHIQWRTVSGQIKRKTL